MPEKQNLQPLLDTQLNQLNLVFSDSDGIDTKALSILGANLALLLFVAQSSGASTLRLWQAFLLWTPLGVSLILDIIAIWPREYTGAVDLEEHPEYLGMDEETLQLQLLADAQHAIDVNTRLNRQRLRASVLSLIITSLSVVPMLVIL